MAKSNPSKLAVPPPTIAGLAPIILGTSPDGFGPAGAKTVVIAVKDAVRVAVLGDPHFHSKTPESRLDDYGDTCIRKFRFVVGKAKELGCSILVLLGDLWNKPNQSTGYYNRVQAEFVRAWKLGIVVVTIPGNHDLPFHKMSKIGDTALGTLVGSGWCPLLSRIRFRLRHEDRTEIVELAGGGIDVETPKRSEGVWRSLCFDHKFWQSGPDEYVLTTDQAAELGHDVYFLGHDHIAYPEALVEHEGREFMVVRPGSMTRATSHFHQSVRQVQFGVMEYTLSRGNSFWYEEIPCLSPDKVYRIEALQKTKKPRKKIDMDNFVDAVEGHELSNQSAWGYLRSMKNVRPPVRKYVEDLLTEHGVSVDRVL